MKVERVGKYRIIALLGQGGMASVYLSVVPGPMGVNKLLVVKLLRQELSEDHDFVTMFVNEARLAARLNHANVVQTYEVGFEDGHHFLAMDYLDGQPLHAVLRKAGRDGVPLDIQVRILIEMLAGLSYAHTLKDFDGTPLAIVHRDVSPQNVFITYDGRVLVVDFGIAKAAGAATNTQSGTFKGKLSYIAPEQASGEAVDARADVFSVGIMLWEAIARRRFAQGDSQAAIMSRRLGGNEPRIREVVPDCDPELADICDRAMAQRPADRYASADELRTALEGFLDRFSRRVGAREVGQFVAGLFAEEREKIRTVIDAQMKRLQRETATELPMPLIDAFPGARDPTPITTVERPSDPSRTGRGQRDAAGVPLLHESGTGNHSPGTLVAAHISQTPPAARTSARNILVGLGFVLVALAVGLGIVLSTNPPAPTTTAAAAAATSVPDAAKIKLSITFGPPGAIAKLDGVPLEGSPFVADVQRDGSMHRIDIEGPGLKPETKMVSYQKDVVVSVSLAPAAADPPKPAESASAAPPDNGKRAATSRGPRVVKPSLGIDEKDPYKK